MSETATVELDYIDVAVIAVALADVRDTLGAGAWNHPNVERLRHKLADAIGELHPIDAEALRRRA